MFEDEVDAAISGAKVAAATLATGTSTLADLGLTLGSSGDQYTALHYTVGDSKTVADLFAGANAGTIGGAIELHDTDGDPKYGDFGKVNTIKTTAGDNNDTADNYSGNSDAEKCSAEDGGAAAKLTKDDDDNVTGVTAYSTLCDAEDVEMEVTLNFHDFGASKAAAHACKASRTLSITCQWDADGGIGRLASDTPVAAIAPGNIDKFLSCKVN